MQTDESYKLDEVEVRVPDLENLVEVLRLVHGKQQAEDIAKCHNNLVDVRYSPLTSEVEKVIKRFEGHLTDYWAEKGREQALAAAQEAQESDEGGEEGEEMLPLPDKPFGAPQVQRAPAMEFEDEPEGDEPQEPEE